MSILVFLFWVSSVSEQLNGNQQTRVRFPYLEPLHMQIPRGGWIQTQILVWLQYLTATNNETLFCKITMKVRLLRSAQRLATSYYLK